MYPLLRQFSIAGLGAGALGSLIFGSLLAGFSFFVVFLCAGLVWRANEPPILPFAVSFQWVFIVAGYLYTRAGGELGEYALIGNVELAVFLSLVGLLCVAIGMRFGLALFGRRSSAAKTDALPDMMPLFWATIITYSVSWIIEISPMEIFFHAAQILYSVLSFREVLFCLLWLTILRRREGYRYGFIALLIALLPRLTSRQSTFKELIFMLLVVVLIEFKPWVKTTAQRLWNRRIATSLGLSVVLLVIAGVVWEGAVKPVWRTIEFEGTPLQTLDAFAHVTAATTSEMDEEKGLEAFITRLSSITQFALVLDRVPSLVPFENGTLTKRALMHVLVPRLLFPNKENLGTDSWLAEEYAGLTVGENTSVGIGYMAEFYVDFGIAGMFPCLLALGLFLGVAYRLIFLLSPNYMIGGVVMIVPFIGSFITFEASLPKLLGGFIMSTLILLILSRFALRLLPSAQEKKLPESAVLLVR
jgi:hypothetical protein